jgi:tetratricopeptide (TPR) repeat protein
LQKVRETSWKPRPLPFIEPLREHEPDAAEAAGVSEEEEILLLLESGREHLRQERPVLAFDAYRTAVSRPSASVNVRTEFGRAFFDTGRFAPAEEILEEALTHAPRDAQLITLLGQTCLALKKHDRAGNLFDQALDIDIGQLPAWLGLAEVLELEDRLEEAETCYRHVLNFTTDNALRARLRGLQKRLAKRPVSEPSAHMPTRRDLIRIYDLAKELKMESKRLIEEVRREGVDVSVPSNTVSKELAEKIRNKYRPKRPRYRPSGHRPIRVVKKTGATKIVSSPAHKSPLDYTPLSATVYERLTSVTSPVAGRAASPAPPTAQSTRPPNTKGKVVRLVRREDADAPAAVRPQTQEVLTLYLTSRVAGAGEQGGPGLLVSVAPHPHRAAQNELQLTRAEAARLVGLSRKKLKRNLSHRLNVKEVRERSALQAQGDLVIEDGVIEAIRRLGA